MTHNSPWRGRRLRPSISLPQQTPQPAIFEITDTPNGPSGMVFAAWHRERAVFAICGAARALSLAAEGFTNAKTIDPQAAGETRAGFYAIGYTELN